MSGRWVVASCMVVKDVKGRGPALHNAAIDAGTNHALVREIRRMDREVFRADRRAARALDACASAAAGTERAEMELAAYQRGVQDQRAATTTEPA